MIYLSVSEYAKKCNFPERTVRNYCATGKIEGAFLTGKIGFNLQITKRFYGSLSVVYIPKNERTYEFTVALRAVTSVDGMTADWAHLPYDFLANISNEIINQVRGINRVVYDISSKPPATIEWE